MSLFKKKSDPISERARALNEQIEALEDQIRSLRTETNHRHGPAPAPSPAPAAPATASAPQPPVADRSPGVASTPGGLRPKLRSTAVPKTAAGDVNPNPFSTAVGEQPVVDMVDHERWQKPSEASTREHYNELGLRKFDLAAAWRRFKNHFRGPVSSNPRLVNYLAAGSVQGLRPLRYEKRVARNRFFVFVAVLILILWGLIYVLVSKR